MKQRFSISANVSIITQDKTFDEEINVVEVAPFESLSHAKRATSGDPNYVIINLKHHIASNTNKAKSAKIKFENSNPCEGYIIADWCPICKVLKYYDSVGFLARIDVV